jgi:hypothetical protein
MRDYNGFIFPIRLVHSNSIRSLTETKNRKPANVDGMIA